MKLYDLDSLNKWSRNLEDYDFIVDIGDVEISINSVVHISDSYYSVGILEPIAERAGVHRIEYNPEADEEYGTQFKCPCCGYVDRDAWELSEGEDDTECGRCGAKLHYGKEPVINYTVKLLEAPPVIEVTA